MGPCGKVLKGSSSIRQAQPVLTSLPPPAAWRRVEALKGELEGSWKLASAQLVQRDADVADALGYLRTELEARNARVAVLERLQQGLAESRGQAAGAAASASEAAQATAAAHAAELAAIHDKLAAAEQFLAERDQLQAALQAAREQAETEKKEHHKRQMAAERKQAQVGCCGCRPRVTPGARLGHPRGTSRLLHAV